MTTDADLTELLAQKLHEVDPISGHAPRWDRLPKMDREWYRIKATAVLPTVAAEVRKAKAEALREAARVMGEWACESLVVIGDELDESTWVEMTAGEWLEHRAAEYETGDSDEHR